MAVPYLSRNLAQHLRKASSSTIWPADCLTKHDRGGREFRGVARLVLAGHGQVSVWALNRANARCQILPTADFTKGSVRAGEQSRACRKATGLAAVTAPTSRTVASDSAGKDRAGRPAEPSRPRTKNADERDWSSVVLETTYGLDSRESVVARGGSAFYLTASANRRRDRRSRRFT